MLRLPLEVINLIIDDLAKYNDKLSSIKACALVCHSFLPLCRKHIFASVTLNARQPSSPISDDLNQLLSNSPHLAVYILNLDYHLNKKYKKEFAKNRASWLLPMFKKLVKLQSLKISYDPYTSRKKVFDWMPLYERKVLLPLLHFPTLTSINLSTIMNFPLADLAGCVNLKNLEIESLECSPNGVGVILEALPPTSVMLERLAINRGVKLVQQLCHARRPDGKPIIDFSSLKEIRSNDIHLHSMTELFRMCKNLHKISLTSMSPPHFNSLSI